MELTNTPKIAASSILLNRAEGPTAECGEVLLTATRSVSAWDRASAMLRAWSHTAPKKGGGYDKCDFTVTFADGETYKGRYDLHHMEVEMPDLAKHLRGELEFYTRRPQARAPERCGLRPRAELQRPLPRGVPRVPRDLRHPVKFRPE